MMWPEANHLEQNNNNNKNWFELISRVRKFKFNLWIQCYILSYFRPKHLYIQINIEVYSSRRKEKMSLFEAIQFKVTCFRKYESLYKNESENFDEHSCVYKKYCFSLQNWTVMKWESFYLNICERVHRAKYYFSCSELSEFVQTWNREWSTLSFT